jgi:flagellin-like hook-associated protein FlgL
MSNVQLLITVGLPMLALAFGMYLNDRRFEAINGRIDDVNRRIDDLRTDLSARLQRVEIAVDNLTSKLVELDNRVIRIETKLGIG